MKRKALLLLCALSLALAVPAAVQAQDELLFAFSGFDYQDPNPDLANYLAVGEGYKIVGFLTSAGPLLESWVDTGVNEYTFHAYDLTVTGRSFSYPFLTVTFAPNGRARYYADPISSGTAAAYGVNPPNATSPSTFIDGSVRIGGDVDNFVLTYRYDLGQGSFGGDMTLDEGADLIYVPPAQRPGWILGSKAGPPNPTIPTGYDSQIEGECRVPGSTPATHKTWGAVKALYR